MTQKYIVKVDRFLILVCVLCAITSIVNGVNHYQNIKLIVEENINLKKELDNNKAMDKR